MSTILKATVVGGRLVVDTPTDLPEGTVVELVPSDPFDVLTPEERANMNASIDRGLAEARAGKGRYLGAFLREL